MSLRTLRTLSIVFLVLFGLFVGIGDRVLPEPMKTNSLNTRTSLTKFVVGLIPNWKPKNPNDRTKEAIEQQEKPQPAKK